MRTERRTGRSWRDAGVLLAVAAVAGWALRGGRHPARPRPAEVPPAATASAPPCPALRPRAVIAVVVAVWVVLSPFVVVYPFGDAGQDLLLATDTAGLLCAVCAVPRLRSRSRSRRSTILLLAAAVLLGAVPYLRGAGPGGVLAVPWWNLTVSATLLIGLAVADLVDGGTADR